MPWGKPPVHESVTCSLVRKPTLRMERIAQHQIHQMMCIYQHREWFSYLVGEINPETAEYTIHSISIPPHEYARGGDAQPVPFNVPENCLGVMHSHHQMGAWHSSTDDTGVDYNYPLSITVAFNRSQMKDPQDFYEYATILNQYTPCKKRITTKDIPISMVMLEPLYNYQEWITAARANVEKLDPKKPEPPKEQLMLGTGGKKEKKTKNHCKDCKNRKICSLDMKEYWKTAGRLCEFTNLDMAKYGDKSLMRQGIREEEEKGTEED